jgi:hypothetical protein
VCSLTQRSARAVLTIASQGKVRLGSILSQKSKADVTKERHPETWPLGSGAPGGLSGRFLTGLQANAGDRSVSVAPSSSVCWLSTIPSRRLPRSVTQRPRAEILPVELEEVESVQHRLADGAVAVQRVEDRDAVRAAYDRLVVQGERADAQLHGGDDDRRVPTAPVVAAPGEQAHSVAIAVDLQPVAVVLVLVNRVRAGGRLRRASGCTAERIRWRGPR